MTAICSLWGILLNIHIKTFILKLPKAKDCTCRLNYMILSMILSYNSISVQMGSGVNGEIQYKIESSVLV